MREYLKESQKQVEEHLRIIQKEINAVFRELNRHLILFATAILSFSLIIFQNEMVINNLNIFDKWILSIIWIVLGLSILLGIAQFYIDYKFFKEMNQAYTSMAKDIIHERVTEEIKSSKYDKDIADENIIEAMIIQEIIKKHKDIPIESSTKCINYQVKCVIISLILLLIFMIKFL